MTRFGTFTELSPGRLQYPDLVFDKEGHWYLYKGKKLSGVTGVIGKRMKKNFESTFVEEGRTQGSHIHDAIEAYITTGEEISVHPAARWATEQLRGYREDYGYTLFSEVVITDRKKYASAIDILALAPDGSVVLFDTKAGNFDREYVSWQLGIYKYFLEGMSTAQVRRCYCLSTKDRDVYPIIPRDEADVKGLLYGK